jgi:hypothetical protein
MHLWDMRDMQAGCWHKPELLSPPLRYTTILVEHNYALRSSHHDTAHTRDNRLENHEKESSIGPSELPGTPHCRINSVTGK